MHGCDSTLQEDNCTQRSLAGYQTPAMASAKMSEKATKPALSSKLLGLKFMQRAANKSRMERAAEQPAQPSNEEHWVKERAARSCVVVYTGDPPVSSTLANRVSFGGHNPEFEASNRRGRPADDDERPVDDAGASISDADLAARLHRLQDSGPELGEAPPKRRRRNGEEDT